MTISMVCEKEEGREAEMVDCKALKDVRRILGTNALSCSKYLRQKLGSWIWLDGQIVSVRGRGRAKEKGRRRGTYGFGPPSSSSGGAMMN